MQIVIDIPEEMMSYINKNEFNAISEAAYGSMAMLAIQNGTPLPTGHRFIDADEILNHAFITEDEEGDIFAQKYYCIDKEVMDKALVLFDTLEEGKEQEDGNNRA